MYLDEKLLNKSPAIIEVANRTLQEYVGYMNENNFRNWVELNENNFVRATEIAYKGIQEHSTSSHLWKSYVHYSILSNQSKKEIFNRFKEGLEILKDKSLPLWEMYLTYLKLTTLTSQKVEEAYKEAIKKGSNNVSVALRPQYLHWINFIKGLQTAEQVYEEIGHLQPPCKEVHKVMARIYLTQVNYDLRKVEDIHLYLCKEFSGDLDVWKEYIEFLQAIKESSRQEVLETMKKGAIACIVNKTDSSLIHQLIDEIFRKEF